MSKHIGSLRALPGWLNRLVVWSQLHDVKGKYAFYRWMCKHYPDCYVCYQFDQASFVLPVDEWCFWLEGGPDNYYPDEFGPFCDLLNNLGPFSFFDLGADIGTVSALVSRNCARLQNIVAFEPNPGSYAMLNYNLAGLEAPALAVNQAVSDFDGMVSFTTSNSQTGDHEGHILPGSTGDTRVTSIDSYLADNVISLADILVLKIDVEGQEVPAVKGALASIQRASGVVLLLEIHPEVLASKGQTPEDMFGEIESILDVSWFVPMFGQRKVDRLQPFFNQFPAQQYDVIALTPSLQHLL
ncbi:FkbM family methyltransferase [Alteromonas sp. ZYF713]|nr:FkbM family methyltransferase [Alteromonas sp. ZYF713]